MIKNWKYLLLIVINCILIVFVIYTINSNKRTVIVDVLRTVDQFEMKKDLEQEIEPSLLFLKNKSDSIGKIIENGIKQNQDIKGLREEQLFWSNKLNSVFEESNRSINDKLWKRLNPLIKKFGDKNGYKVIIGGNGMGTVLYSDEASDVTQLLIEFINKNYKEGEK